MDIRIAISCTYDGIFKIPAWLIRKANIKPKEKIKVRFNRNRISVSKVRPKDKNLEYYTYVLSDNSCLVKNPHWHGSFITLIKINKKGKIDLIKDR
jgi:hypothetical protein